MKPLRDVLELLYGSTKRWESIRAVLELTVDLGKAREADRLAERLGRWTKYARLGQHDSETGELARTYHLWFSAHFGAWRLETGGANGPIVLRSEGEAKKGNRWWSLPWRIMPGPMDPLLNLHVDPSPLISTTWFEIQDELTYLEREAILLTAVPRPDRDFLAIGVPYAPRYEITVDVDFGVLLAFDAFLGESAFIRSRMTDVHFNEHLPQTLFTED